MAEADAKVATGLQGVRRTFFKRTGLLGLGVLGVGSIYYFARLSQNKKANAGEWNARFGELSAPFRADPHKFVQQNGPITLFRYRTCPYCGKAQNFLDWHKIAYNVTEVDPMAKTELRSVGYTKVPVVQLSNGGQMVDSDEIVNSLVESTRTEVTPEIDKWRAWVRDRLVRHLVVNVNKTMKDAIHAFDYVKNEPTIGWRSRFSAQVIGGPIMYMVAHMSSAKKLGLKKGDDAEKVLHTELDEWIASFPPKSRFHGGAKPDLADVEVYGALRSVEPLPFNQKLQEWPGVGQWMSDMSTIVKPQGVPAGQAAAVALRGAQQTPVGKSESKLAKIK